MGKKFLVLASLLLSACSGRAEQQAPGATDESIFKSEIMLAGRLPDGARPVGIAVGDRGQRYVFDQREGLWELGESGPATLVFPTVDLRPYGLDTTQPIFTDVVSLGADRFAVTAENTGYLLDVYNQTFAEYFCYFPPPSELPPEPESGSDAGAENPVFVGTISQELQLQGIPIKQRTESVTYSPDSFLLFAQPRTIRLDTDEVAGSELFVFDQTGGEPIQTRVLDTAFVAEGMVAIDGERLLLGNNRSLFEMTVEAGPTLVRTLDEQLDIAGMAIDTDGDLLLLDRTKNRLLELDRP